MTAEAPERVTITLPPLHPMQQAIAKDPTRFKVVCCGRRWGKTMLAMVLCLRSALQGKRIWHVAPSYKQTMEGWAYLHRLVMQMPPQVATVRLSELTVSFAGGGSIQMRTADNPDNLRGSGLDGVVLDEAATMKPEAWEVVLRPALADKQGWALFISTPQHYNWFYDLFARGEKGEPDWARWQQPTWNNPFIAEKEIEAAQRDMEPADFDQEFGASFTAVGGAIFPLLSANRPMYLRPMSEGLDIRRTGIGMDWGCLTLDTEILTRQGFKAHHELIIGEEVASVRGHTARQKDAGRSEMEIVWTPLLNKIYRPNEPLVRLGGGHTGFHFSCTPDHAWLSRHARTGVVRRLGLNESGRNRKLVIASECHETGVIDCTPGEAALMGWLATEGWIQGDWQEGKFTAAVSQKSFVAEMLADLDDSGIPYREMRSNAQGVRQWYLAAGPMRSLFARLRFMGWQSLPSIVTGLAEEARVRMLNAMMLGDGSWKHQHFKQNEGPVLDAFLILATLSGYKVTGGSIQRSQFGSPDKICRVYRLSTRREQRLPNYVVAGRSDTWCPSVEYGSVIARQGQQITVTGNTTKEHNAAVVCGSLTSTGAVWIRSAWLSDTGDDNAWFDEATRAKRDYRASFARVDRSQSSARGRLSALGYDADTGVADVEARVGAYQGLIRRPALFFDLNGPGVRDYYNHLCEYHRDPATGKPVEVHDDDVDAGGYLLKELVEPKPEPVSRVSFGPKSAPSRGEFRKF